MKLETESPESAEFVSANAEVENAVSHICLQLVQLHNAWADLKVLFADRSSIAALDRVAIELFAMLRTAIPDYIILAICRLDDPAIQGHGRKQSKNLTFKYFFGLLPEALETVVVAQYVTCEADLVELRKHRDKRISHNDLPTLTGDVDMPPMIQIERIERVLTVYGNVLNLVTIDLFGYAGIFDGYSDDTDAARLLKILANATTVGGEFSK